MKSTHHLALALRVMSDSWDELRHSAFTESQNSTGLSPVPDLSLEAAQQRSETAKSLLVSIEQVLQVQLPHPVELALRQSRYRLASISREADWYWNVMDPAGAGFYGQFGPAPYCGAFALNLLLQSARSFVVARPSDFDRYLGFVNDYARMVEQMAERTAGQAERGILIPRPQIPSARGVISGFRDRSRRDLVLDLTRIPDALRSSSARFLQEVQSRIELRVIKAFDTLAGLLSSKYEERASTSVGMSQFEGGSEIYADLVKFHTASNLTPEQVHERGLERMEGIQADMRRIRAEAGLADDASAYLARAATDPRFSASTTEGVAAVFQRYIDRMDRVFDSAFHTRPKAPHGVAPLPQSMEGGMTFGYYSPAKPGGDGGHFLFNARNLREQPLLNIASLNYHELVPGHHLHLSTQNENESLHPLSRFAFCGPFNEGWAEYAATLAGELGLYEEPEERYGRHIMDAFLTSRLVVDTGMNALGWSLERARDYMRKNSSMSEVEIQSETLRYSCDLPAQALAYKLGDTEMLRLRGKMKDALGHRFDLKDFHAAVLEFGAMPFSDLEWHLDHVTQSQLGRQL